MHIWDFWYIRWHGLGQGASAFRMASTFLFTGWLLFSPFLYLFSLRETAGKAIMHEINDMDLGLIGNLLLHEAMTTGVLSCTKYDISL